MSQTRDSFLFDENGHRLAEMAGGSWDFAHGHVIRMIWSLAGLHLSYGCLHLSGPCQSTLPSCKSSIIFLLFSQRNSAIIPVGNQDDGAMKQKKDVLQGTLALMVLKTLDVLGPLHGYGVARRIEQISGDLLAVNQGTLYPVLLKLEQEGAIASEWGASENNRRARFYRLTREGRKQLQVETQDWQQTAAIIGRFFAAKAEDLR